ncbi:hypothetical protein [Aliikangiella coralliicola]|uniref:Fibronectin type III domain-containing protein n=1 Tax=Aliikangiella coralliicola TaxID=2592383 RepID=A0A545U5W5_9GAMM|nr:hypothetical protein [Aliikangiella coralliicola]TQV84846.1 hypothetical protein FLL46_20825 [Aliikangiella coralliicola]
MVKNTLIFGFLLMVKTFVFIPNFAIAALGEKPPPIPLNVQRFADGDGAYNVTWGLVSQATFYKFWERRSDGAWKQIGGNLPASQMSYSVSGRTNGLYYYVIHSCNQYGCSGLLTAAVTVDLNSQNPVVNASWNAHAVDYNSQATFSWNSTYADKCTLNGSQVATSGSKAYTLTETTTNTLTCTNQWAGGDLNKSVSATVGVKPPPIPLNVQDFVDGDGAYTVTWGNVQQASYYVLWEKKDGVWKNIPCTNVMLGSYITPECRLSSSTLSYALSGRTDGNYSYVVHSCNQYGCGGLLTAKVEVDLDSQNPIVNASWNANAVDYNSQATFSWNSTYADECTLDGSIVSTSGNQVYTLTKETTKTLTCKNKWAGGELNKSASATIGVKPPPIPLNVQEFVDGDGAYTVTWGEVQQADYYVLWEKKDGVWKNIPCTDVMLGSYITTECKLPSSTLSYALSGRTNGSYAYVVHSCNQYGCGGLLTAKVEVDLDNQNPVVDANWNAHSMNYNSQAIFSWNSTYADECTLDGNIVSTSGTQTYTLTETTTKTLTCTNHWAGGEKHSSAQSTIEVRASNDPKMEATYAGVYLYKGHDIDDRVDTGTGSAIENSDADNDADGDGFENYGQKHVFFEGDSHDEGIYEDNCREKNTVQNLTGYDHNYDKLGLNLDCLAHRVAQSKSNTYFYRFSGHSPTHWDKFGDFINKLNEKAPNTKVYAYLSPGEDINVGTTPPGTPPIGVFERNLKKIVEKLVTDFGTNEHFAGVAIDDWTRVIDEKPTEYNSTELLAIREVLKANQRPLDLLITAYLHNEFFGYSRNKQSKTNSYRIICGTNISDENGACFSFDGIIYVLMEYTDFRHLDENEKIVGSYRGVSPLVGEYIHEDKDSNGNDVYMLGIKEQLKMVKKGINNVKTRIYPLFYVTGYDSHLNTDIAYLNTVPREIYGMSDGLFMYHLQTYKHHQRYKSQTKDWKLRFEAIFNLFNSL